MSNIFDDGLGSGTYIVLEDGTVKEIPEEEVVRENNIKEE